MRFVDIEDETISLRRVLAAVSGARRLKLVILDACRSDPSRAPTQNRAINRGLAPIEPDEGNVLVAYAARAGTVANDGEPGGNSPYTRALLKHLGTPGLDIELALRKVRDDVLTATDDQQEPFTYGSLSGDELPLVQRIAALPSTSAGDQSPPTAAAPAVATPAETARLESTPDPSIAECDQLAASTFDSERPAGVPGVQLEKIDADKAVPACRQANAAKPNTARLEYELARAVGRLVGRVVDADLEEFTLFQSAAERGYIAAFVGLGDTYAYGEGVPKDLVQAASWYRRAAEAGDGLGMANLGDMYENGKGVPKDLGQAAFWYRKAADAGVGRVMTYLGDMYENGAGVSKDLGQAVSWYRKAADAGDALGMIFLGQDYELGRGVVKDLAKAEQLYRNAIAIGGDVKDLAQSDLEQLLQPENAAKK